MFNVVIRKTLQPKDGSKWVHLQRQYPRFPFPPYVGLSLGSGDWADTLAKVFFDLERGFDCDVGVYQEPQDPSHPFKEVVDFHISHGWENVS